MYFVDNEVFVDDRIITPESEGRLHKALAKIRQAAAKGYSNISPQKAKVMTLGEMNQLKPTVL
jgi:hypothetical protein